MAENFRWANSNKRGGGRGGRGRAPGGGGMGAGAGPEPPTRGAGGGAGGGAAERPGSAGTGRPGSAAGQSTRVRRHSLGARCAAPPPPPAGPRPPPPPAARPRPPPARRSLAARHSDSGPGPGAQGRKGLRGHCRARNSAASSGLTVRNGDARAGRRWTPASELTSPARLTPPKQQPTGLGRECGGAAGGSCPVEVPGAGAQDFSRAQLQ